MDSVDLSQTELYSKKAILPIIHLLKNIPSDFERVRLMKLSPGATIKKHTDKVDKDFVNEKIFRFHLPLETNDDVSYFFWEDGIKKEMKMYFGNIYYFDVRLPHSVKNNSDVDRINLVVDVFVNEKIKEMICRTI